MYIKCTYGLPSVLSKMVLGLMENISPTRIPVLAAMSTIGAIQLCFSVFRKYSTTWSTCSDVKYDYAVGVLYSLPRKVGDTLDVLVFARLFENLNYHRGVMVGCVVAQVSFVGEIIEEIVDVSGLIFGGGSCPKVAKSVEFFGHFEGPFFMCPVPHTSGFIVGIF